MPIMLEAVMRVRASKGKETFTPSLEQSSSVQSRFAHGLIPWKLLRSLHRPPRDARRAYRSILRY